MIFGVIHESQSMHNVNYTGIDCLESTCVDQQFHILPCAF